MPKALTWKAWHSTACALGMSLTLAGCTADDVSRRPPSKDAPNNNPSNTPGTGSSTGAPTSTQTCVPRDYAGPLLPTAFANACGTCHSALGIPSNDFPDLFDFKADLGEFKARVRNGGALMPAFATDAFSDEAITQTYNYFKAGVVLSGDPCDSNGSGPVTVDTCAGKISVTPLFETTTSVPAVVETRADGVIVTRGGGRVRGRHENEETFNPYHSNYFENRSYGFEITDTVATGGGVVKFTYLPTHAVSEFGAKTNFRAWKIYGEGNVFHTNTDMKKVTPQQLETEIKNNARDDRPLQKGDLLEFEFGIFIAGNNAGDPDKIEGRTAYYTDTFRYQVGFGGLTADNRDPRVGRLGPELPAAILGGSGTMPYISNLTGEEFFYFSQMTLNIQGHTAQSFLEGRRLFHTDFLNGEHSETGNPVFSAMQNKAGPFLNQTDCASCHMHNGPGIPPAAGQAMSSMVVKLFDTGDDEHGAARAHPAYGKQLQDRRSDAGSGEGQAFVNYTEVGGKFADGTPYVLRKPNIEFKNLSAGPITHFSARLARRLIGLGLLEAIPESTLIGRADPTDCDKNGISGRPNLVFDPVSKATKLGRFGWKAAKASITHQVAEALLVDLGVTSSVFPNAECGEKQAGCTSAATPELADTDLQKLVTYMRSLAVPPRRDLEDASVKRGEQLFGQVGCVGCHAPSTKTSNIHPNVEFRDQVIFPYSDLLLHDMGTDLADNSVHDYVAEPSEWRTPPLWGIGLVSQVLCKPEHKPGGYEGPCLEAGYLHDGRARSLLEAVLWHGGEAQAVKDRVIALPTADRDALFKFVSSL